MSTTVELVRANERYARLRAAVEALAAEWEFDRLIENEAWCEWSCHTERAAELRALLAAVDS